MRAEMLAEWPVDVPARRPLPARTRWSTTLLFVAVADEYREDTLAGSRSRRAQSGGSGGGAWSGGRRGRAGRRRRRARHRRGCEARARGGGDARAGGRSRSGRPSPRSLRCRSPWRKWSPTPRSIAEPEVGGGCGRRARGGCGAGASSRRRRPRPLLPAGATGAAYLRPAGEREDRTRRPWRRRSAGDETFAEVPALPPRPGRLPDRSRRDD